MEDEGHEVMAFSLKDDLTKSLLRTFEIENEYYGSHSQRFFYRTIAPFYTRFSLLQNFKELKNEIGPVNTNELTLGDVNFNRESDIYYILLRRFLKSKNYNVRNRYSEFKNVKLLDLRDHLYNLFNSIRKRSPIAHKQLKPKFEVFKDEILGLTIFKQAHSSLGGLELDHLNSSDLDFFNIGKFFTPTDFFKNRYKNVKVKIPKDVYDYFLKGRSTKISKYFSSDFDLDKFSLLVLYPLVLYFYGMVYNVDIDLQKRRGWRDSGGSVEIISDVGNVLNVIQDYIEKEVKGARKDIYVPDGDSFYKRALKIVRSL